MSQSISFKMEKFHPALSSSMRKAVIILIVFLVLFPFEIKAKDYYVDAMHGSDDNSGLSEEQPWKSLKKINSTHFEPGDNIFLKRGSVWEEELIISSSGAVGMPIQFRAYGQGNRPLIKSSNVFNDWVFHAKRGNVKIWRGGIAGTRNYWGARAGDARLPKYHEYDVAGSEWSAPADVLDMKEGHFYAPINAGRFFIRSDTGKPPAMDIGVRKYAIYIKDRKHILISDIDVAGPSGLDMKGSMTNYGQLGFFLITIESSDSITIQNSASRFHPLGGVLVINGTTNCTMQNLDASNHGSTGIYLWKAGNGNIIIRAQVSLCGSVLTDCGDMGSIGVYKTPGVVIEKCQVRDNGHPGIKKIDAAISFVQSPMGEVHRCHIKNTGGTGIQFAESSDYGIAAYNIIDRWGVYGGKHREGIRIGGGISASTARGCRVYNNLFINGGISKGEWAALRVLHRENERLEVKNNIFFNNEGIYEVFAESRDHFRNWVFSNNIYYRTSGNAIKWNTAIYDFMHIIGKGKGFYSYDQNQETGSKDENPRLNYQKMVLENQSPCIDAGAEVGLRQDYHGNRVPNGKIPDIGPFEYHQ